jgi:hypothetical protein
VLTGSWSPHFDSRKWLNERFSDGETTQHTLPAGTRGIEERVLEELLAGDQ